MSLLIGFTGPPGCGKNAAADHLVAHHDFRQVAFADAIAPMEGIASGIGAMTYGAQLVIEAETSDQAVNLAIPAFEEAAAAAGLPVWPLTGAEVVGEHDEFEDLE